MDKIKKQLAWQDDVDKALLDKVDKEEGKSLVDDDEFASVKNSIVNIENKETDLENALLDKVDKEEGKSLVSDTELEIIKARIDDAENKETDLENTLLDKVDKEEGKSLVDDAEFASVKEFVVDVTLKELDWDNAVTHSNSDHAPSNAQENVIEAVKVNNVAIIPNDKSINITVPTVTDVYNATSSDAMSGKAVAEALNAFNGVSTTIISKDEPQNQSENEIWLQPYE